MGKMNEIIFSIIWEPLINILITISVWMAIIGITIIVITTFWKKWAEYMWEKEEEILLNNRKKEKEKNNVKSNE